MGEPTSEESGKVLVLRTCKADMTSHGEFRWPKSGPVSCPDWEPTNECGHGLHGFLFGEGDGNLADWSVDAKWLVVEVEAGSLVDLGGKVKFPKGNVVYCGDRLAATDFVRENGGAGRLIIGSTITGGDGSTITGGYGSTITGGDGSTITGGYGSTITGGYGSTITGGDASTITGGDRSTITGGYGSTITGGYGSTITGGDASTITGGDASTITGGDRSTITGGDASTIVISWWDSAKSRRRCVTGYVGEDGIEPGVAYEADGCGKLVPISAGKQ